MVAYFKRQNNLFMLFGAVAMLLMSVPFYKSWLPGQEFYVRTFFLALPAFTGVIIGRLCASLWANRKLRQMDRLLYEKADPQEFIREFGPLVKGAPRQTVEYVNGQIKLAYAYEAMGQFEKGLELMKDLKPEELRLHVLTARSLMVNQKARLYLLLEDMGKAEEQLEKLRELQEEALGRVPALASSLKECIRLAEVWLEFLKEKSCNENYIVEEMNLAKNVIHKGEMQLLLARMKQRQGEIEEAEKLLRGLTEYGPELYSGKEAVRLLKETAPSLCR